jgi:hypothetical protein
MDPAPDPTPFISKAAKKYFFSSYFFIITYQQAHYIQSKKFEFLPKFYLASIVSVHSTPL